MLKELWDGARETTLINEPNNNISQRIFRVSSELYNYTDNNTRFICIYIYICDLIDKRINHTVVL